MKKFSKNKKLNKVLKSIYSDLKVLGKSEILRYKNEFKNELDYNIYCDDIRDLYSDYKSLKSASFEKIENIYKRQIRYIVNTCF